MKYPMRNDYDVAIRNLHKFVFDDSLIAGKPVVQKRNPSLLRSHNGGKAIVYEIKTNPKKYALKCWVEDLGNLKNRYKEIDEYLKECNLPYFIDFAYKEEGILVNGKKYPIVRMEWFEGVNFKDFITFNISTPVNIRILAEDFLKMVKDLHMNKISHGDLQHGNIKVGTNGKLGLIDYDSMYVPKLANETDDIKGLPGYQHPARDRLSSLSKKADYFSELVIYLSLLTLSEEPSYWKHIEKEERLLFSQDDFVQPKSSSVFSELKKLSPEIQYLAGELEKFCIETDIERLEPLENCIDAYTGTRINWDFSSSPTPVIIPVSNNTAGKTSTLNSSRTARNMHSTQARGKPITTSSTKTNSWDKLSTNSSAKKNKNSWDKLSTNSSAKKNKNSWDKLDAPSSAKSSWNSLDSETNSARSERRQVYRNSSNSDIWEKFIDSVSSIWSKIINWFKP